MPDLATFGKYLGGGFGFGAFGGRADLLARFDPFRADALPHAGTFNNNVFSMRVGAAAFRDVFTPERAANLYDEGEALRARLNGICADLAIPAQFIGRGSVMALHFTDRPVRSPEDVPDQVDRRALLHLDLLETGLYSAARSQFALSLPMTKADRALIADTIGAAIERRASSIAGCDRRSIPCCLMRQSHRRAWPGDPRTSRDPTRSALKRRRVVSRHASGSRPTIRLRETDFTEVGQVDV